LIISGSLHINDDVSVDGVEWVLKGHNNIDSPVEDEKLINLINDGDHLTVYGESGEIIFHSMIVKTIHSNRFSSQGYIGTRQFAGDLQCHWLQHGECPNKWASMFKRKLKAKLAKGVYSITDIENFRTSTPCSDTKLKFSEMLHQRHSFWIQHEKPKFINTRTGLTNETYTDLDEYNSRLLNLHLSHTTEINNRNYVWFRYHELPTNVEPIAHFDVLPSDGQIQPLVSQVTIPDFEKLVIENVPDIDLQGRFDDASMRFIELSENERGVVHNAEKDAWAEIFEHFEAVMANQQVFSINIDGNLHYVSVASFDN